MLWCIWCVYLHLRSTPHPATVTTRIITFLVGNPNLNLHLPLLLGGGTTQPSFLLPQLPIECPSKVPFSTKKRTGSPETVGLRDHRDGQCPHLQTSGKKWMVERNVYLRFVVFVGDWCFLISGSFRVGETQKQISSEGTWICFLLVIFGPDSIPWD